MEYKIVIFLMTFYKGKGKETNRESQRVFGGEKNIILLKVTEYILNLFYINGLRYSVKHDGLNCQ